MSPRNSFPPGKISLGVIAALAVAALVALVVAGSFLSSKSGSVAQPMRFSHKLHFEDATCAACHLYATELAKAGTPTLEDCTDCHDNILSEKPEDQEEEKKLDIYVDEEREIPWVHLPSLPPDTYFSHRRHVELAEEKIECEVCHGNIGESDTLPASHPYSFTMDWCMDCHEDREADNDCLICHR